MTDAVKHFDEKVKELALARANFPSSEGIPPQLFESLKKMYLAGFQKGVLLAFDALDNGGKISLHDAIMRMETG